MNTYNVGGSGPGVRLRLQRSSPPDISFCLVDGNERIITFLLHGLLERLDDEWYSVRLELAHSLEGEDRLDGDPTILVEGGQGEEISVDREVRVGKVKVDCISRQLRLYYIRYRYRFDVPCLATLAESASASSLDSSEMSLVS